MLTMKMTKTFIAERRQKKRATMTGANQSNHLLETPVIRLVTKEVKTLICHRRIVTTHVEYILQVGTPFFGGILVSTITLGMAGDLACLTESKAKNQNTKEKRRDNTK